MSDIDTTEAERAAEVAIWRNATRDVTGSIDHPTAARVARRAVAAALPHIERQVRESLRLRMTTDARDVILGIPFDSDHDVAIVTTWIDEWFEAQS